MRRPIGQLLAALVICTAMGGATMAQSLSELQWQNRVLILFGTDGTAIEEQSSELLKGRDALAERDMLVLAVAGDRLDPVYGPVPDGEDAQSLRARFGVDPAAPFTAILIGKDGQKKWRADSVVPRAEIEAVIDAMPMRRAGR